MATSTPGNYITAEASTDLSAKQYHVAKLDANGKAALATAATDAISGVLDEVPQGASGLCSIAHISGAGTGKVKAGGTIAKGAYITANADGEAVSATQTTAGQQPTVRVFGRAREAAVENDIFEYEKCHFLY